MTEIDSQVYLVMLRNIIYTLLVLHVHGHKLIAYLRGVFRVVFFTKLLRCYCDFQLRFVFQFYSFAFYFLTPAVFVETLSKENHVK